MKPGAPFSALAATWTGAAWATGTFISSSDPNGNFDAFVGNGQAMTADMIVDVVGYFRAPSGGLPGGGSGGTVTNVATGTGLSGGPITSTGTIALANTYKLPQSCADAQVPKYNASTAVWECANDTVGTGGGGAGTVTNVATGAGLTGGPITTSGTIGLAATQLLPTTACAANQIAKWNGSAWACAADAVGTGGAANAWVQGGNAFGAPGVMGTTDNQPLTVGIGNGNGLRVLPSGVAGEPAVINGASVNFLPSGAAFSEGVTIAGGGSKDMNCGPSSTASCANSASGRYSSVGGGFYNRTGGQSATVAGGTSNLASAFGATVSGGGPNTASGDNSVVAGGGVNTAEGNSSVVGGGGSNYVDIGAEFGTISGGNSNTVTGPFGIVAGGEANRAEGDRSTVAGGALNKASGSYSTVAGGRSNDARGAYSTIAGGLGNNALGDLSFAAGFSANATRDGQFVWADSRPNRFNPEALGAFGGGANVANTFSVRATGGVWFVTSITASGVPTYMPI